LEFIGGFVSEIMTSEEKLWIDNATYEQLLHRWRFSPNGDKIFIGESGKYYTKVLTDRRGENPEEHVRISKRIGWKKS
jgi:hypothetical protein